MKKFLATLLTLCCILNLLPTATATNATFSSTENYTYNDRVSNLSTNWNPHTYGTSDQSYPIDFLTSGLYSFYFNDALHPVAGKAPYEGYVIVPEMAASLPVDVTEWIKAERPEFGIPSDAVSGYAYTIDLNPNACWEDGTPITADDYVESMKRLLDPKLQNYRASGHYNIAGAERYAKAGTTAHTMIRSIMDNTETHDWDAFLAAYGDLNAYVNWYYSFGDTYDFSTGEWIGYADDEIVDTGVTLSEFYPFFLQAVQDIIGQDAETASDWARDEIYVLQSYPEVPYDGTVGLYKSGEYQITMVLNTYLAGFNLLYDLGSNWLVKCDLYDDCLTEIFNDDGSSYWISTYCTSVETTCSYGPYKMTSFEPDQRMHFVRNENWYGYTDGNHVYVDPDDSQTYPMYQTTEIDCQVAYDTKNMFLRGELIQYGLQSEDLDLYRNSPYAHFTPGQATYFLMLNGNMDAIREREAAPGFDQTAKDLEVLTLTSFHRALTLSYDRSLYCDTNSPAQSPAFGLIGNAYICDPETGTRYRDTDEAKQVLCDVYSVDVSRYASLDDAVASITGYDPVAAKEWYTRAFDEALTAGFITDNDLDGICDQTIEITYSVSTSSEKLLSILDWFTEQGNAVTAGTPFEGKLKFVASDSLGDNWNYYLTNGLTDICLCGWNGSAMNPYSLMNVYTNPDYQYDAQWFDSSSVDMTLNIYGQSITMNLREWTLALNGTPVNKNGTKYNFGDGIAAPEVRLQILAGLEKSILLQYNNLPFTEAGSWALLSQKVSYVVDDYNPVMGRGGIQYLRYNYNDAEWAAYVAECGGVLDYSGSTATKNGLVEENGIWLYYMDGVLQTGYTGLVLHTDSIWYYVENGVVNFTFTGLTYFNNTFFYIQNGVLDVSYTGLVEFYGAWYYVEGGIINFNFTGLTYFNGTFFYIQNGVLDVSYTGLVEFYGAWYYVEGGIINFNFTGLTYFNGTFFYVQNGVLDVGYTGLVEFYGAWYYVEGGIINFAFSGLTYFNGTFFYIQNGILDVGYVGLVEFYGVYYYVSGGIIDFSYSGPAYAPDGTAYNVVGGIAYP